MSVTDDEAATTAPELPRRHLRVSEFAERNGISPSQARIEIASGRLKAKRLGQRRVLIPVEAEVEWAERLEQA